jgi:hypothetical protein
MPALPLQCPLCTGILQIDSAWAGQQVACPLCHGVITVPPASMLGAILSSGDVAGPPIDVPVVAVQDRPKIVGSGSRQVVVHRLSSAEKAQRRLRKNAIVFGLCIVVLVIVFYFLTRPQ